jgi:hypothetical protein
MSENTSDRPRWTKVLAIAGGVLAFSAFVLVFLVLTGIIAEPETVIESIIRWVIDR